MFTTWHCVEHTVQCRENIWQVPSNYQHSSLNIQQCTCHHSGCTTLLLCQGVFTQYMLQLGQIPPSIMLYLPQLCFKSQQHRILASVDFLCLVSYCIQAFRNVTGLENHDSGTVCSRKGKTCYTTVIALLRTPCGSEFNHRQETMVMVLWFPWLQKGEGAAQLRVLCDQLLSVL